MAYRCTVRRYGTVLYHYGGDLVHALSVSLGQARNQTLPAVEKNNSDDFQSTLSETCLALNAKCHACIERLVKEDAANPHKIENMDIDKFINEIVLEIALLPDCTDTSYAYSLLYYYVLSCDSCMTHS